MGLTKFVLKRPVTAILSILCLIVFGYSSVTGATMELSPEMDMSMMIVMTTYSGANPEDMDELVTKEIENTVSTLSGLKSISSTSSEGSSMVMLEYDYGTDMDEAYDDLKKKIDLAERNLPDDASTPSVIEMNMNSQADIRLSINNPSEDSLYNYVNDEIVPEFEKLSMVAEVTVMGGNEEYIKVELIPEKMEQYGITMSTIASDIAASDLSYPAGDTRVGSQELSVSTRMKYQTEESLKDLPLTTSDNSIVYLQDVANIYTTASESSSIARYNGDETISLSISKQQSSTSMELSEAVQKTISTLTRENSDLNVVVVSDSADSIQSSLFSVVETLLMAIVISMVIIWLFFGDIKASLIAGSSIPISILAALILMNLMDFSLNVITLSALTLGVGMMVDNSIVVLESCFRVTDSRNGGFIEYLKDALEGTRIVGASVAGGTATTCVVFLPLAFLSGMTGQMFKPLGFTIVFCMAASLLSAITIVPLCYMLYRPKEKAKAPLSQPITRLQNAYRKVMKTILPKKKTVMFTSVALLLFSFFLAGQLGTELMASDDQGQVSISVETRPGLVTEEVDKILRQVENIISQNEDLESYMTTSGGGGMRGSSSASITAYLRDDRKMETAKVAALWKEQLSEVTNCNITVDVSSSMSMMSGAFESYDVILKSADYDDLKEVMNTVVAELMERPEISRVHSTLENSSPVIEITVDPIRAKAVGLTASGIGSTVNQMISGMEATSLDVDGNDISVMVEYKDDEYKSIDQVKNIVLSTPKGGFVALTDVADISFQDSPASISRSDKQYQVTISGEYTDSADENTKNLINQEVVTPNLTSTVSIGMNSRDTSMNEEFSSLFSAIATAAFLIFVVMAAQFESPKFSIMVMTTIPFSLIGAFGLLFLTNTKISMVSLLGFLMLIGTVVNNGILYVETVNQYRETMERDVALIEAGATRLRPILMTTLTTVIAMIPMALALGNSGSMTQGLAIVNIGGLCASTLLSLLMLPVYYSIMSRTPKKKRRDTDEAVSNEDPTP